tara:strand:- start:156 stop:1112 length:957 start_codon:yes stop_codon:yes gene_type:complete
MSDVPGTRILVTGALGQIGTELVEELRQKFGNEKVISSDIRYQEGHASTTQGPFMTLDVLDTDSLISACRQNEIGTIYHLAAILSATGEMNPELCRKVNVGGTISVLEAAKECSLRVYSPSSIAVFGPDSPKHAPQDADLNPTTVYGETKVTGEALAREYLSEFGIDIRGIRYPGLISYKAPAGGGTTDYAVEIFHAALNSGHYECFVRPDTRLPMLYMEDAINATISLMEAPDESLGSFRSGYNIPCISFTAQELADAISDRVEGFTCDFVPDIRQDYADSWPNSVDGEVATKEWGWAPDFDLELIVDSMLTGISQS